MGLVLLEKIGYFLPSFIFHVLEHGVGTLVSAGKQNADRVCIVSALLSDAEGPLESLIPQQAFWLACVWAGLLPYVCVGGWLEAGVLHF